MNVSNEITTNRRFKKLKKENKDAWKAYEKQHTSKNIYLDIQVFPDLKKCLSSKHAFADRDKTCLNTPFLFHYIMGTQQCLAFNFSDIIISQKQ